MDEKEDLQQARERFTRNYLNLAGPGAPMSWLEENIGPLLLIACPGPREYFGHTPMAAPTRPEILLTSDAFIDFYTQPEPVSMTA